MIKQNLTIAVFLLHFLFLYSSTTSASETPTTPLQWAKQLADTIQTGSPEAWQMRKSDGKYRWGYTQGLVLKGFLSINDIEPTKRYVDYTKAYLDHYIDKDGNIATYQMDKFNIDSINSGKLLFYIYESTSDEKYFKALQTLRKQLDWHPRTRSNVFWHKRIYPWQIWLDGLYMATPFYAEYDKKFDKSKNTADIIHQFEESYKQLLNKKNGLLYHGYDESHIQSWSNPETGLSEEYWARALGWYAMALVDTVEHIEKKKDRKKLESIIKKLFPAILKYQDANSGLWYQVIDKAGEQDNYLESSASAMFIYSFHKAHRLGIVDAKFKASAEKAFKGFTQEKHLTFDKATGKVELHNICRSAGLGGHPYRDGSYNYYVREAEKVSNDAHGLGAMLLALVELATK